MLKLQTTLGFATTIICIVTICQQASAINRKLAPATFQVNSPGANSQPLPHVNGLHLDGGQDRPDNSPPEVYNPGEPKLNFALVRWEARKMPLKIWISNGIKLPEVPFDQLQATRVDTVTHLVFDTDKPLEGLPTAPGWTEHTNDVVAAGIEEWREFETEGLFKFAFVDDPRMADILVFFTDTFKDADSPGGIAIGGNTSAQVYPLAQAKLRHKPTVIELSTSVNHTDERMYGAAAHEFGHALGIKAHSEKRQDIMFVDRVVTHLSPSDKATIRWLYHRPTQYVF